MPRPKRDISDEERRMEHNAYHTAYGHKLWKCDTCNIEMKYFCRRGHLKSNKHRVNGLERWKCEDCNIEIPNTDAYKKKHLDSKQHLVIQLYRQRVPPV